MDMKYSMMQSAFIFAYGLALNAHFTAAVLMAAFGLAIGMQEKQKIGKEVLIFIGIELSIALFFHIIAAMPVLGMILPAHVLCCAWMAKQDHEQMNQLLYYSWLVLFLLDLFLPHLDLAMRILSGVMILLVFLPITLTDWARVR